MVSQQMRKLDNKEIDGIGKVLVKTGALTVRDIETIAAKPELFDGVLSRIAADGPRPVERKRVLRPIAAGFTGVTLVSAAAIFVVLHGGGDPGLEKAVATTPPASDRTQAAANRQASKGDEIADPKRVAVSVDEPVVEAPSRPMKIANRTGLRPERAHRSAEVVQQVRSTDSFYAVSYAGDPHETERGGRIVRVDIPRSTLFAMGVDIPLENERDTVKADLLIGSDGVTRAIRVVE
jgi:hypothetical protein